MIEGKPLVNCEYVFPNLKCYQNNINPVPPLPTRRVRSLRRAPTPGGAPSQLLQKKQKTKKKRHSRIRDRSHLIFAAECKWS